VDVMLLEMLCLMTYVWKRRETAVTQVTPTLSPYDQFVMKNGIQFGFDAQHTGFNPYESELSSANVSTLVQAWTASTGGWITSRPAVANGIVYIGGWLGGEPGWLRLPPGRSRWGSVAISWLAVMPSIMPVSGGGNNKRSKRKARLKRRK
jgi:hypothetical protein